MSNREPSTELDARYSHAKATATPWAQAVAWLTAAEVFWLSTVRPDGRPHVTPLLAVWLDDALHFCTGADERKARNLAGNQQCVLTTGTNSLHEGFDLVLEGDAVRVRDDARLRRLAEAFEAKYGAQWHFDVVDGAFKGQSEGQRAEVFVVAPTTVFGFGKGEYSQTRWRFDHA
ncbi:pyridoxamine 5'-phosphate oxidase family protein [Streptomyces sp. SID3343]|uniref:pyridoxamine 5'-phosphate oxidase family protein n=1 Tax=Streptomyces sp. SID3343 TaxID=2690260 RepID=UPI00136C501C|nr:pyridoxamine 5'-phosphate oxidase family protein [Streptomyces sp. SID3343]MYW05000.1 pyridoxamine 5'-phosphate oxidase family protein [Streptomyces sp. SID3343]